MNDIRTLEQLLNGLNEQPERVGYELRTDLARLVILGMARRNWKQRQLAAAAGMKPSFVSRVLHSDTNCTFEVAGRLLHALGIEVSLVEYCTQTISTAVEPQTSSTEPIHGEVTSQTQDINEVVRILGPAGIETGGREIRRSFSQNPMGRFIHLDDKAGRSGDTVVCNDVAKSSSRHRSFTTRHAR